MNVTESVARTKRCCSGGITNCSASECMAWRWAIPPKLEFTRSLTVRRVSQITGEIEIADAAETIHGEEFMRNALKNPSVIAILTSVTDDWICTSEPSFDEYGFVLCASFSRAVDDTATGYCGLCPGGRHD